jgi:hypothetical protein
MFTNGMPNYGQSVNSNPIPAVGAFPIDTELTAGANPETVAINMGSLGYGGTPYGLTDGANIAVPLPDQAFAATPLNTGQVIQYSVTLAGNRTLTNPTGTPTNGQELIFYITQDGTGNRTLAFGNKYIFPGASHTISTGANAVDRIRAMYNVALDKYFCTLEKAFA